MVKKKEVVIINVEIINVVIELIYSVILILIFKIIELRIVGKVNEIKN